MARTANPRVRPALVEAAGGLFYADGVGPTSLDAVAAASGVTKPTLYRHFPSKEALVGAYLEDRHRRMADELSQWVAAAPPERRAAAVVDWLCRWLDRPGFNGCAFVRAMAELPGDAEVAARARERKRVLLATIRQACRDSGAADPAALALEVMLIVEGATARVHVSGGARQAAAAARRLARLALEAEGVQA